MKLFAAGLTLGFCAGWIGGFWDGMEWLRRGGAVR